MNFRRRGRDEPEINLIPFIDVLLVVLIFLVMTTTYSRFAELQIRLPLANTEAMQQRPREILLGITSDGRYTVDRQPLDSRDMQTLAQALQQAAAAAQEPVLVLSADASTPHQAVVTAMEAARHAGLQQLTFATQKSAGR